ncbi:MAG: response regulator transcription factor [Oscillospiraceae bacterium]|nr:response regulator transcription factor [Oscillospiraceae bacterium]
MKILVVEDEPRLAEALAQLLRDGGWQADTAADGPTGLELARSGAYAGLVLDVMLPGLDGFGVCRALRAEGNPLPILMLTARWSVADKVEGLDCGADDYMTKPFAPEELLARVRALTRRQGQGEPSIAPTELAFADLRLELGSHALRREDRSVQLSPKEFDLLRLLMQKAGAVCPKAVILEQLWGGAEDKNVDAYISSLRKKFSDLGSRAPIATLRKVGYRLEDTEA